MVRVSLRTWRNHTAVHKEAADRTAADGRNSPVAARNLESTTVTRVTMATEPVKPLMGAAHSTVVQALPRPRLVTGLLATEAATLREEATVEEATVGEAMVGEDTAVAVATGTLLNRKGPPSPRNPPGR